MFILAKANLVYSFQSTGLSASIDEIQYDFLLLDKYYFFNIDLKNYHWLSTTCNLMTYFEIYKNSTVILKSKWYFNV